MYYIVETDKSFDKSSNDLEEAVKNMVLVCYIYTI